MSEEKVEAVLLSAQSSVGLPMLAQERSALMTLAGEAHRALKDFKKAKAEVERLSENTVAQALAPATVKTTAAVLLADVGDPRDFPCARAYLKAFGLNLRERAAGC